MPVMRSGKTSKKTRAIFLAPDDGDKAEGVAGYAWASNTVTVADGLPALVATSSDARINTYAQRTFCPTAIVREYVQQKRPLPRSIGAIPIEVNHEQWGVLVLDSREENGVTIELVNNFTLTVHAIGQFLEKAK
ncbi:hypothetical protein [Parvibaculum sp.]|uniref:hypothetical protein n=1 Tax=Parvibaculum sp. TaxID=2024848 RepID=UPI00321146C0